MYSQGSEEEAILKFFGDKRDGRFLDIGAADGRTFSNTLALAERGWSGVCVEAAAHHFVGLKKTYEQNPNIALVNAAMDAQGGCAMFYDTPDVLGSLSLKHKEKWEGLAPFREIYVAKITIDQLFEVLPGPYDFVTIDIEDRSIETLTMFPSLKELGVKLLCVEIQDGEDTVKVKKLMDVWGYTLVHKTEGNELFQVT